MPDIYVGLRSSTSKMLATPLLVDVYHPQYWILSINVFRQRLYHHFIQGWCAKINKFTGLSFHSDVKTIYTLGKKGCYTRIEDNRTNVDRKFVFPLGWNWHDMDPWLFPNEIRHYLGQTFNASSSGIVERWSFPQINLHTVTTLNQYLHIFSEVFLIVRTMPRPTPMGIRHEVFALAREGIKQGAIAARVGLTRAYVNRILKRHAAAGSLVPGKSSGAPRKTTPRQDRALLRMVRQDRFLSARPWRRGWEICTEWGLVAQRLTTDSCSVVTGHIDPQRSPCWLPTTVVSAWNGRRGGGTWQWPTGSMSSSVMSRDSNFTR